MQGAVVPDAGNLFLLVAIEPDSPALDPVNVKVTLQPVKVPSMTAAQLAQPIKPAIPPFPWMGNAGHLVYAFKDLPVGTYDSFVWLEKVPRAVGKGTTWALGHTRLELKLGLLTMAYVAVQRQRPVLSVLDPLLDVDVPPMQRRRKVLATIHKMFPMSKDSDAKKNGVKPPYNQGEYKPMHMGTVDQYGKAENTCTAVNGSVMENACGAALGAAVTKHPSFVRYAKGLAPSVGDTVYYGTDNQFYHIGIIVESSPHDGANWIAADGGQPDRTSEFKEGSTYIQEGVKVWGRFWHSPEYTGPLARESAWLLPRQFVLRNGDPVAVHGWAGPVAEVAHGYPILGWSDITHPERPFPNASYDSNGTEADYHACKALIRTVRHGAIADQLVCRQEYETKNPRKP
ncbi:MAG: hypothetical protein HOV80_13220 [Polyangiaceae bacterium]|nr:hypothetical protein [Polyangiaceae bacterium]